MLKIQKIGEGGFHVVGGNGHTSMLSRYGILKDSLRRSYAPDATLTEEKEAVLLHGTKRDVRVSYELFEEGFRLSIPLERGERLFGIGDATRDCLMVRGQSAEIYVANVSAYGPQPMLISSKGWAIFVNCTYRMMFDIGKTDPDLLTVFAARGKMDFYLFTANSMKETQEALTDITGKPTMLPAFAYGLTIVNNEQTDALRLIENAVKVRERKIPCDIMGLEPSWMVGRYDFTLNKRWDPEKFYLPHWREPEYAGDYSFMFPVREQGMKLSLWLCENYDLLYEEDRLAGEQDIGESTEYIEERKRQYQKNAAFTDEHLIASWKTDRQTNPDEPWFNHLRKFVDNGASCFKLDGSNQVLEHPDRLWGMRYTDDEVHNVYPVLLAKQMNLGFREHTDRRLMCYSAGAYAGIQQYVATWAGDTGGGERPLVSVLNYAMCGHTNTSCDLDICNPASVHYAFLLSWTQLLCWANYKYPWYLSKEREDLFRDYSVLRSSLFPYLYTMAHKANVTGLPIVRPLPLVYEDTDRFDNVKNAYMLGDSLYVGAFNMHLSLPKGRWIDYFKNDDVYEGEVDYAVLPKHGGALFVKAGTVMVTMKPQLYIMEKAHDYIIDVYPGGNGSFTLYEDDGYTYDYEKQGYAETPMTLTDNGRTGYTLTVGARRGGFAGRPDNGADIVANSIPEIKGMQPVADMEVKLHCGVPSAVLMNGKPVAFTADAESGTATLVLPADLHGAGDVTFEIRY